MPRSSAMAPAAFLAFPPRESTNTAIPAIVSDFQLPAHQDPGLLNIPGMEKSSNGKTIVTLPYFHVAFLIRSNRLNFHRK